MLWLTSACWRRRAVHVDEDAFRTACAQALLSRQIPVPELFLQWGDLGHSEAIVPLGPVPSVEAKTVDFLQYMTIGALCDPTADIPAAALSWRVVSRDHACYSHKNTTWLSGMGPRNSLPPSEGRTEASRAPLFPSHSGHSPDRWSSDPGDAPRA